MGTKGLGALAAVFVSAAGIALYFGVFNSRLGWLLIVVGIAVIAGGLLTGAGHLLMARRPVTAVWLIEAIPIASLAIGILVTFGAARAGVVVRQHLDHLPKAENDTLTEAIASVIAGLAAFLVLNGLADRASWLWPRRHIQSAFQRRFRRRWRSGTAATDAVFESTVLGARPVIRGWGFSARRHRAKVIAAALAGNGTPPFVPVTGPAPEPRPSAETTQTDS